MYYYLECDRTDLYITGCACAAVDTEINMAKKVHVCVN